MAAGAAAVAMAERVSDRTPTPPAAAAPATRPQRTRSACRSSPSPPAGAAGRAPRPAAGHQALLGLGCSSRAEWLSKRARAGHVGRAACVAGTAGGGGGACALRRLGRVASSGRHTGPAKCCLTLTTHHITTAYAAPGTTQRCSPCWNHSIVPFGIVKCFVSDKKDRYIVAHLTALVSHGGPDHELQPRCKAGNLFLKQI